MTTAKTHTHPWDVTRCLDSNEAIVAYLDAVLQEEDPALLAAALPNPHRRDARRPGPGLRRLAAHHSAAAEISGATSTTCLGL